MVLYDNININQKVEVLRNGRIYPATVKYKGTLNGVGGDWVGVSFDLPIGKHDGMLAGRRYFQCKDKHGLFTQALNIRFQPSRRCLYNKYRTVSKSSEVEEDLFRSAPKYPHQYGKISEDYVLDVDSKFSSPQLLTQTYPLRHAISRTVPPATSVRNVHTARSLTATYRSAPIHYEYENDDMNFAPTPTIPKTHMPHEALMDQVRRGWSARDHYVRELTVNTARDSIKFNLWNDISV